MSFWTRRGVCSDDERIDEVKSHGLGLEEVAPGKFKLEMKKQLSQDAF